MKYKKDTELVSLKVNFRKRMQNKWPGIKCTELGCILAFTEVAAEIAFRCIVKNGYKREKAIEETHGIVMIDELDLHLHPNWQKHVVADLCRAFPNI